MNNGRCSTSGGAMLLAAIVLASGVAHAQVVRTADADVRGFRGNDFPRMTQLADNVYAYEDLMGELGTSFAFTTNSLIVVPGHGFVDSTVVLREELATFRRSLENLVAESRRLHDAKVPVEAAPRSINLGEFQYWYRAVNNVPDAIAQVYLEIDGKLN